MASTRIWRHWPVFSHIYGVLFPIISEAMVLIQCSGPTSEHMIDLKGRRTTLRDESSILIIVLKNNKMLFSKLDPANWARFSCFFKTVLGSNLGWNVSCRPRSAFVQLRNVDLLLITWSLFIEMLYWVCFNRASRDLDGE